MPDPRLPSYADVQAAQQARPELKQAFSTLTTDQLDIQQLFKSVAAQLETTPQIGENHALCKEWNELRQRHRKIYRDSQQNAGLCANFLHNFTEILLPLAHSDVSKKQKKFMIGKFLETIPIHQASAKETSEKFNELAKDVETFPLKVAAALRGQAEPAGVFWSLWTGLEDLCMSIWKNLHHLLVKIVDMFKAMLNRLEKMRFSCFGVSLDVHFARYTAVADNDDWGPGVHIKEDCRDITEKLTAFEEAWHRIGVACSQLSFDLAMAKSFAAIPSAYNNNIKAAETVHAPLVECLRAYSLGRDPDFR